MWKQLLVLVMFVLPLALACPASFYPSQDVILDDQIVSQGINAECNASLYNDSQVLVNQSPMVQSGLNYRVNFSKLQLGEYDATFECWSNGTFYSGGCSFSVGGDEGDGMLGYVVLIPILVAFLMVVVAALLGEDHNILKWGMLMAALLLTLESVNWGINIIGQLFGFEELIGMMGQYVWEFMMFMGFLFMYFLVYFLVKLIKSTQYKKRKKIEMMGNDGDLL